MNAVAVIKLSGHGKAAHYSREQYSLLLESGLKFITGESSLKAALEKIFPKGTIGMKTNCLVKKLNSTPVALTESMGDLLIESGWRENDIVIWERTNRELKSAGYQLNASSQGRRCLGTDSNGVGYGRDFFGYGKVNSLVTQIMTDLVNYNINMPVLKDHSIAGLSASLKNMYGAIHNPNKYHDNNCSPFAAHVSRLKPILDKNRLTIIDAVKIQYNAGPGFDSRYLANYGGIIMSTDPVAADSIGLKIVEHLRRRHKLPSLKEANRPATYLEVASEIGLGTTDPDKFNLKVFEIDNGGMMVERGLFDG